MNPGERAWSLAYRAAEKLVAFATNIRHRDEIRVRVRAERLLAKSWLPAAALLVATSGSRAPLFDIVDRDAAPAIRDAYTAWANEVVDLARRTACI